MKAKRTIFFVLCALFVFFTANSSFALANSVPTTEKNSIITVSEKEVDVEKNYAITSIKELGGFIVKGNENVYSGFQHFQNTKKHLITNLATLSTRTFTAYYTTYCQYRENSINAAPFYIAYHRLTI